MAHDRRCAVLGDPIDHSLSPTLHRAAYDAHGLDWTYEAIQVRAGELAGFVAGLDGAWRGLSLTMPLKREAMQLSSVVSRRALLVGAANTLILDGGDVHADNTDLPGAVAAVRERYVGPVHSATVIGGGATAASTGLALVDAGAREIVMLVRSPERAEESRRVIAGHPASPRVVVGSLDDDAASGQVVVSTVPAEAQTPDLVARCADVPVVFEVLYHPWPTPLAAAAEDRVLVTGLDLLVHQAALQFEMFTGLPAPLAEMREAGERALPDRQ